MNTKEITEKISDYKTTEKKLHYLNGLENKIGIVKPETRQAFYQKLGDLSVESNRLLDAESYYKKGNIADKEAWKKLGMTYLSKRGELEEAERVFKMGKFSDKQANATIGDYLFEGAREAAMNYPLMYSLSDGAADECEERKRMFLREAMQYYAKAGLKEKVELVSEILQNPSHYGSFEPVKKKKIGGDEK